MRPYFLLLFMIIHHTMKAQNLSTPYENSDNTETATYKEAIAYYRMLDRKFPTVDIQKAGATDASYPLHVVYFSKDGNFDVETWHRQHKLIILINNGIHPGEPDGIDASMMLIRDAATGKLQVPEHVVLAVIPVFNIGGALNRGSFSRANQNGPKAYGFRGNAQNLDLNRDFIKLDAKETQTLVQLFHKLDPDIFIDNHVSNGADYQHVMTLLTVNGKKQGYAMGDYLDHALEPAIYKAMQQKGYDLVPYVNHWGHTPDKGWPQFYDPPRFTSGFAALFGTFAFVPETHMLKPYRQRVEATYSLMQCFIDYANEKAGEIKEIRAAERNIVRGRTNMILDWEVDTGRHSEITFKGYEAKYRPSDVSGKPRLYYDRNMPYTKTIPYYNIFIPAAQAVVPKAYIIPHGWQKVIERLKWNNVQMTLVEQDTIMQLTVYRIKSFETLPKPFESHYLHSKVVFEQQKENIQLRKGDYIIYTDQPAKRYLTETLEPNAPDAFFAWGFFDAILQQKEHFSDYVFEDEAARLLQKDSHLQQLFTAKKQSDPGFANDGTAQLEFIYEHSAYYEPEYMRYPVFRMD